ncbi:MAG: adenylosuccinate lyase, partial [Firmicutes bacterium]|nr:adenylosuccinate lyase [Bacillota bacterium]
MIERYTLPEMKHIWSDQNKFQKWLDVEIAACEAMAELGQIPAEALETIKARAAFSVERVLEAFGRWN